MPTGFIDFDNKTSGLQPSDLIIVAARPSMGKTAFALTIAQNFSVNTGEAVGIFSLEMSKEQIIQRMLGSQARIDGHKIRTGFLSASDWPRLTKAAEELTQSNIIIDDTPGISALELRAKARRLKSKYNIKMIILDYIQLMRGSFKSESRQQEISEISRSLKALARELSIPVIALSQLSRAVENRTEKIPQLSDLRESGAIEQDADVVVLLYRKEYYYREDESCKGIADIIIEKQRNGPTGKIKLAFLNEYVRFENLVLE